MRSYTALPFFLRRSTSDVMGMGEFTSTKERIDGLLRLEDERLVVQWRLARRTERIGVAMHTERELEPVREVVLPLDALAAAEVRAGGWRWLAGPLIVLTAADLRAFEAITGEAGLKLDHPATLALRIRRSDRLAAREFAADLNLALAERALGEEREPADGLQPRQAPPPLTAGEASRSLPRSAAGDSAGAPATGASPRADGSAQ